MNLGITHAEVITLLSGKSVEFIFQQNEGLPDINVILKEVEEDAPISEVMQLTTELISDDS